LGGRSLESLVIPEISAAEEAGKLLLNLPELFNAASLSEQRKLLLTMLEAVYVDTKQSKSIVAVRPKPPFRPIFQVAATKEGSGIRIINEPLGGSSVFQVELDSPPPPPGSSNNASLLPLALFHLEIIQIGRTPDLPAHWKFITGRDTKGEFSNLA
jgi:hypothetical protein